MRRWYSPIVRICWRDRACLVRAYRECIMSKDYSNPWYCRLIRPSHWNALNCARFNKQSHNDFARIKLKLMLFIVLYFMRGMLLR